MIHRLHPPPPSPQALYFILVLRRLIQLPASRLPRSLLNGHVIQPRIPCKVIFLLRQIVQAKIERLRHACLAYISSNPIPSPASFYDTLLPAPFPSHHPSSLTRVNRAVLGMLFPHSRYQNGTRATDCSGHPDSVLRILPLTD